MRADVLVVVFLGLLAGGVTSAGGAVVELPAVQDGTLFDIVADTLSSSGSGPHLFAGRNSGGNTRRALLRFPVADSIPAGSTIESVELRLRVSQAPNTSERAVTVHRVSVDWGEGASSSTGGAGDSPEPGDVTWVHRFFPDQSWTTAGGDFAATPSATTTIGDVGPYAWSGPGLVADVQAWLAGTASNFGWLLAGVETASSTVKRLGSRENPDPAARPVLVVTFTPPDVPVRATTWGAVKAGIGGLR